MCASGDVAIHHDNPHLIRLIDSLEFFLSAKCQQRSSRTRTSHEDLDWLVKEDVARRSVDGHAGLLLQAVNRERYDTELFHPDGEMFDVDHLDVTDRL
jgi:hypothetical protein